MLQVLTWAAYRNDRFGQNKTAQTVTATYDPASEKITEFTVTKTFHDMFCPGIATLGSGAIVVTGGDNAEKTSIYDPDAAAWMPGPDMTIRRGYQATTLTSEGKVRDVMHECATPRVCAGFSFQLDSDQVHYAVASSGRSRESQHRYKFCYLPELSRNDCDRCNVRLVYTPLWSSDCMGLRVSPLVCMSVAGVTHVITRKA